MTIFFLQCWKNALRSILGTANFQGSYNGRFVLGFFLRGGVGGGKGDKWLELFSPEVWKIF